MIELILLIISFTCKRLLGLLFFIHGTFIAIKRWEMLKYWKEIAIMNDKWLNVIGKYTLNQTLSKNDVFGNPMETVSAAMHHAELHKFGRFWYRFVSRLDANHFYKASRMHRDKIIKEYNRVYDTY